ncbi:MAG TPA: diguanylate cyclase [Azospira sp.]|nr:diguanylate cyclase [Azospira sp.]
MESILETWEKFAHEIIPERHMDSAEARDHAKGIILAIAADLDRTQTADEQEEKSKGRGPPGIAESPARLHGQVRKISGFNINEEVAEFRALRASIVRLWSGRHPRGNPFDQLLRFNEAIDQALAESVAGFSAEKEQLAYLFDTLLSASQDLHYIFDLDGRFIYANQALTNLHATSLRDIVGKNLFDLSYPAAAEFQQYLDRVIATKAPCRQDFSHTLPHRAEVTYECILVPVMNEQGVIKAVAGTARDMSERKRMEMKLAREMTISDTIIESSPGSFFLLDRQYNLLRWNKYFRAQTGESDEQLRGHSMLSIIHEEDRSLAAAKFMAAFATGYTHMEVRLKTPDLGLRYYLKTARRIMLDGEPHIACFGIDITERRKMEDALEKEKAFFDALIEGVPGAFFVIDLEGNYFRWNSYLKRLTGLSDQQLLQRPSLLTFQEEDRPLMAKTMQDALEKGYGQVELHVITGDADIRPFFLTMRSFQVGVTPYLVSVGTDITEWLARMKVLEHDAWTDPLTQTANRGHFMELAKEEFERCRRYGHPLSVWMLDIDHFKAVNDTYGHHAGDLALQALVSTSRKALRDWDLLGRMGGEEFAVLLPETEPEQSLQVANRLRIAVANTTGSSENGEPPHITVSIGIATVHDNDTDLADLFKRADQALYEAKRTGRDRVCLEQTHGAT